MQYYSQICIHLVVGIIISKLSIYIQNYDIGPIKCYLNLPTLAKTDFSLVSLPFACCTEVGRSIEVVSVENKKNQTIIFIHKFYQLFDFVLNSILDQTVGVSKKLPPNTLKLGNMCQQYLPSCLFENEISLFFSVQTLGFGLSFVEISSEHTSYCSTISLTDSL